MAMAAAARKFEDKPATRDRTPLLMGLMGPSGSGKTFSALRLATGIKAVYGGDIFLIDTEACRAKHYAETFQFRHVEFRPPFGPLDYLAAIEHCNSKKPSVIIVDSMSHEHEGPGGVLEMHEAEVQRLSGGDYRKAERVKMLAWSRPKQERRRLINTLMQMQTNFIFCFRAKEKIKIKTGEDPKGLGFMPIAGEEFVYEMALNCLLYPGANGVPTWKSDEIGERLMIKLPAQFRALLEGRVQPLNEDIGRSLAEWASGAKASEFSIAAQRIVDAASIAALEELVPVLQTLKEKKLVQPKEFNLLRESYGERLKALQDYQRSLEDEQAEAELGGVQPAFDPETGEALQQQSADA